MTTQWLAAHRSMQEGVAEVDNNTRCAMSINTRCAMSIKKGWGGEAERGGGIHSTPQHASSTQTQAGIVCIEGVACMQQSTCYSTIGKNIATPGCPPGAMQRAAAHP
jgi:hypothetical protein